MVESIKKIVSRLKVFHTFPYDFLGRFYDPIKNQKIVLWHLSNSRTLLNV